VVVHHSDRAYVTAGGRLVLGPFWRSSRRYGDRLPLRGLARTPIDFA
jgi:hypothetical protein